MKIRYWRKEQDPELDPDHDPDPNPDPLVRGTDPRIRIRTVPKCHATGTLVGTIYVDISKLTSVFLSNSTEQEALAYNEGDAEDEDDDEDDDDEGGELVVVSSEAGALVKQELWAGDDTIPRQAPQNTVIS